ncbi:uncharacterized protein LOC128547711 [Mercenaria mercenaria]|uniref:uncharacterized protein LOC128547711 n=1 Tax=Mercenaria mercenaria TaxID=6596 RepID=UPI00234EABA6|nr:uncharacterized protein LOC128547711 [Mercenaria mercenaria]
MNRAFSWKDHSAQILRKYFRESTKKHFLAEDDDCDEDENDHESTVDEDDEDNDDDDIKTTDDSVFEMSSRSRQLALQQLPDLDSRIRQRRELTDIIVSPELPPRRTEYFSASAQQVLAQNGNLPAFRMHRLVLDEKKYNDVMLCLSNESSVTFKFQYLIMTERLKETTVKASNLFKRSESEKDLAVVVEVCLMPGNVQRQVTSLCKGTRNPDFNSVVYFSGLSLTEMHQMCLRIKINGRDGRTGSLTRLGEVTVPLDNFDIIGETVLEEHINKNRL